MKYNELKVKPHRKIKRVGRGISAGQGKTAGRGTKGQNARAGSSKKPGFAGGQNPLMQQLPKLPGFRSPHIKAENVFTDQLDELKTQEITAEILAKAGNISNPYVKVKLLFRGEVKNKLIIKLPLASENAISSIQAAGGSFEKVSRIGRPSKSTKQ
jgi:large subunit ribosomal protein L15